MLVVIVGLALAALVWIILRARARRSDDPVRAQRLGDALRALAEPSGLRVESPSSDYGPCVLSGTERGVAFCVEPGTRGMLFDGDVAIVAPCPTLTGRVVVWPREPPDEIIEGLGEERPTRDPVFDARFAVFASFAAMMLVVDDAALRKSIYDLGIVALVIGNAEVVLLLPGVPDVDSLASATAIVADVVTRCRRVETVDGDRGLAPSGRRDAVPSRS